MAGSLSVQSNMGQSNLLSTSQAYAEFAKVMFWSTIRSGESPSRNAVSLSTDKSISSGHTAYAQSERSIFLDFSNCSPALTSSKVGTPMGTYASLKSLISSVPFIYRIVLCFRR